MPRDLSKFNRTTNLGNAFARFDYMNALPTLNFCKGLLAVFEGGRKQGIRLSRNQLRDEQRAYLAIKNNEYVTNNYKWLEM